MLIVVFLLLAAAEGDDDVGRNLLEKEEEEEGKGNLLVDRVVDQIMAGLLRLGDQGKGGWDLIARGLENEEEEIGQSPDGHVMFPHRAMFLSFPPKKANAEKLFARPRQTAASDMHNRTGAGLLSVIQDGYRARPVVSQIR